jgi:hypothetical protein
MCLAIVGLMKNGSDLNTKSVLGVKPISISTVSVAQNNYQYNDYAITDSRVSWKSWKCPAPHAFAVVMNMSFQTSFNCFISK